MKMRVKKEPCATTQDRQKVHNICYISILPS